MGTAFLTLALLGAAKSLLGTEDKKKKKNERPYGASWMDAAWFGDNHRPMS